MDLPSPQTLGDVYSMNPGAFAQAQGIIGQGQQAADLSQMMNQQRYDQDSVMNPLRAQQLQGQNDTTNAMLPGIVANSAMKTRENSNQAATNEATIKDALGKLSQADRQRHIQDIDDAGSMFRQQAAQVLNNPIGAADRAKAELVNAGHADMWNPEWSTLPPESLAMALKAQGDNIGTTTQKMLELSAGLEAKQRMAAGLEQEKQKGRLALRDSMNSSAAQIEKMRQAGQDGRLKMTSDQAAVRYGQLADNAEQAGDGEMAQALRARRDQAIQTAVKERAAGTEAGNAVKPDLNEFDVKTVPVNPIVPTPPLRSQRQAEPTSSGKSVFAPVEHNINDPVEMVTKAFGEPMNLDKYEYRQDPATGKLQRKLRTGPLPKAN